MTQNDTTDDTRAMTEGVRFDGVDTLEITVSLENADQFIDNIQIPLFNAVCQAADGFNPSSSTNFQRTVRLEGTLSIDVVEDER